MTGRYRTTEAYLSGGIGGRLWMPGVSGGRPIRVNLRGPFGIMGRFTEPATFADTLELIVSEQGGDFQDARFTADTRITVIRRSGLQAGRYTVHVWERELAELPGCAAWVDPDVYTGDLFTDEE